MNRALDNDNGGDSTAAVKSKPKVTKNRQGSIQKWRLAVQIGFALLCVWIGIEMHIFVKYLESGGSTTFIQRPPGVEGFLPISSLMSLYYFFLSGEIHPAHPAGMVILVAIIMLSLVFGKAFCSWLCPVGLISEALGDLGEKIFRRRITMPRWLDYPLRSLKYLLLAFFVYSIFFVMGKFALRAFLDGDYNLVSDIKMYYFFAQISQVSMIVIGALALVSIPLRGFWCRNLCPYGALLGLLSLASPHKIKRNPVSCIDCGKCALKCPSFIKVDKIKTVVSDECASCMACVDVCPVADTLEVKSLLTRKPVHKRWVAIATVGIFAAITGLGMITGYWNNKITTEEYMQHQQYIEGYGHPTDPDGLSKMNQNTAAQRR
ncbi:MAG: 4Fe-4S binding protein [Candidatus Zixiibacteriota bacterium]